jgi:hypothetical protein
VIDPVFRVAVFIHLVVRWFTLREAVGPVVLFSRDVDELKVKE